MRVIAGQAKGRFLKPVPGTHTRPTTDKVKESIFNMIYPYINGGDVLDLFAGTGGLGIEALSRGMEHAIFIDRNRKSIEVIKQNLETTGFSSQAEVYLNEAERALKVLYKREVHFDMVFLDPPYKLNMIEKLLHTFYEYTLINSNGIIVTEHDSKVELAERIDHFRVIKKAIYGNTGITIFQNEI